MKSRVRISAFVALGRLLAGVTPFVALVLVVSLTSTHAAWGQVLIGDVFIDEYEGWTDTFNGVPQAGVGPNWGIHLQRDTLMESSDGRAGDGTAANGDYTPYVMVNTQSLLADTYDLSATLRTSDNDGFGLVFGYQDLDNYFRVSLRGQAANLGFPQGVAVQKVVGGVATQIAGPDATFLPPTNADPIEAGVSVDGPAWAVSVGGTEILSGSDADLSAGGYGVLSWAQKQVSAATSGQWGTELERIAVDAGASSVEHTFASASPVAWRTLAMTNSAGAQGAEGEDLGNFRLDFRGGTIQDDTNGYEWATADTPNVDFIGPAIAVDEPGSDALADYQMRVRLANLDDDGIGVLVRVQDDDNFYRVNFARQAMDDAGQRAPQGMSVQKVKDGVWTELFRDDQENPLFVFTDRTADRDEIPFDLTVRATGNALAIQVIDDPDGAATVIDYPLIVDTDDPLLSGSVGLTNWGSGDADNGVVFSRFGGASGPLLVVPEPCTLILLALGALAVLPVAIRRRRGAARRGSA